MTGYDSRDQLMLSTGPGVTAGRNNNRVGVVANNRIPEKPQKYTGNGNNSIWGCY